MKLHELKLGEEFIFAAELVKNPNPRGRQQMVTPEHAERWLRENRGVVKTRHEVEPQKTNPFNTVVQPVAKEQQQKNAQALEQNKNLQAAVAPGSPERKSLGAKLRGLSDAIPKDRIKEIAAKLGKAVAVGGVLTGTAILGFYVGKWTGVSPGGIGISPWHQACREGTTLIPNLMSVNVMKMLGAISFPAVTFSQMLKHKIIGATEDMSEEEKFVRAVLEHIAQHIETGTLDKNIWVKSMESVG